MKNKNPARSLLIFISNSCALQPVKLLVIIIFAALFITACSNSNRKTETSAPSGNSVLQTSPANNQNAAPKEINAICKNPYYPTDTAQKREYHIEGNLSSTYILTQTANGSDSFTETRSFPSGGKVETNWECTTEGLRNTEYTGFVPTPTGAFEMTTADSSGVTLPKDNWEVGKKWTTEYVVKIRMDNTPIANLSLTGIKIDNEIAALNQKIKIAGGEFETARIDSTVQMSLPVKGKNPAVNIKLSSWYSPQAGLVKQKVDSPFGSATVEYVGEK